MLIGVLSICGLYYVVASLVFPGDPTEWTSLDDHYDRQRKMLVGASWPPIVTDRRPDPVEIIVPAPDGRPR